MIWEIIAYVIAGLVLAGVIKVVYESAKMADEEFAAIEDAEKLAEARRRLEESMRYPYEINVW